ncbi:MAG: Transcriptional regulator, LysR family [uncultured Solirubrobacteraceae bacterium]|uniref:Transcriptional regulator, LysR family n=1 Tax=uncultured Solirubrobacteraceae bacterium TaxID=1162706 RepID=A0A6J4STE0_9ACTN|nr:MAG: Transcriptional regulator, LysR family [uncultured Solirubrobacteraceae bacterium]
MLDVKRLRVLREVSARGSFSAAAEALSYTQSAVSQQIAALEREAGTVLVERNARGVRMTDAGRALVAHADVILARLADAEAELEAIAGMRGGRLRMVSFPTAGATIAPRAIARFRERHPGVEVTLEPREPDEGLDCLKAGACDIALTVEAGFEPIVDGAIERHHLLDDPFYVCVRAGHRVATKARVRLADLAEESWILGTTGRCPDGLVLERACQGAGFEPRVAFQSDDYSAIQGFVAAGVGVCLIPDLALVAVRDDVVIRCLEGRPLVRRVLAATLADGYVSPAAAAMLEILDEVGAEWAQQQGSLALAG